MQGFIRGITVAVVGVLLGTSYLVARSAIRDALGVTILAIALLILWSKWKVPEPLLVGIGAIVGLATVLVTHASPRFQAGGPATRVERFLSDLPGF